MSFEHGAFALTLSLPASIDDLIDTSDANVDERLPYWADIWPSSRALARVVLDAEPAPSAALELGCGVGLVALACALRGTRVLATDYEEAALGYVESNARANGLAVDVRQLDWRKIPAEVAARPLVLAADVLYEARNIEPLVSALGRLTTADGEVWLADPGRRFLSDFLAAAQNAGWSSQLIGRRDEPDGDSKRGFVAVSVYRLTRRRGAER